MNVRKRGKDSGGSELAKNKLFGAIGHVNDSFSMNSRKGHRAKGYGRDENAGGFKVVDFEAEMPRIEAGVVAQRLIARFQMS